MPALERLRWMLLGYDVSGDEVRRALAALRECDADAASGEHRLLDVFTDVRALTRARHDIPSASCCTARRSTCTRSCARSTPRPSGCPSAS